MHKEIIEKPNKPTISFQEAVNSLKPAGHKSKRPKSKKLNNKSRT